MLNYLIKRFISGFFLLIVFISILFFLIQILLPGDFASHYAISLTTEQLHELRQQLGLDLPIWKRYFLWISNLLRGDLGNSFTMFGLGLPVTQILKSTIPLTLLIFGLGTIFSFFLGQWLGRVTAWRRNGFLSGVVTFFSVAFYTSFPPWLAFLVLYIFTWKFNLPYAMQSRARLSGLKVEETHILLMMLAGLLIACLITFIIYICIKRVRIRRLPSSTYLLLIIIIWLTSWFIMEIQAEVLNIISLIALPTLTYVLLSFGEMMIIMRSTMVETLNEDYIQTARAKGLSDRAVRDRHAARNALLPVISRLIISLPFLLSGMIMLESVMDVQGIGTALFYSVGMQNVNMAVSIMFVIGVISLITRLILEVVQAILDPRIRTIKNP